MPPATTPQTFRQIIDLWPTRVALQEDIRRFTKRPANVRDWYWRDSIPVRLFAPIIKAAALHGFAGVTYPVLSEIRRLRRSSR